MSALAALLRVERRHAALAPWRTALFGALVAAPAATWVAATALQRTLAPTSEGGAFEAVAAQVVGGFGFAVAALVIGAAAAVGHERRGHELAQLLACGARRRTIAAALVLSTAVVALAASLVGVLFGASAAALLLPLYDAWTGGDHALELVPSAFVSAPTLGVLVAVGAAAPSIHRATRPTKAPPGPALERRERRARIAAAVLACVAGFALVALARPASRASAVWTLGSGSLLGLVGTAGLAGPLMRCLARAVGRAPLAARLAARDAARAPGRSSAAALAILAGLAGMTLIGSLASAVERVARANGDAPRGMEPLLVLAFVGASLAGLLVVAAATALNAVEGRRDTWLLAVHGAHPRTVLAVHGARAAHLALVGGVLSVPAGLLPALGLVRLAEVPLTFAVPWRELSLALVVLPALAFGLGAALGLAIEGSHTLGAARRPDVAAPSNPNSHR